MNAPRGNIVDLARTRGVQIAENAIIIPAGVDVFADGMAQAGCVLALRVIDIPHSRAMWVPMPANIAREIARQLLETADLVEAKHAV